MGFSPSTKHQTTTSIYSNIIDATDGSFTNSLTVSGVPVLTTGSGGIQAGDLTGRNAVINGNFDIWQRETSINNIASSAFCADRWTLVRNGTIGGVDFSQSADPAPSGRRSAYAHLATVGTAATTVDPGDSVVIAHRIEGYNANRFGLGDAGATNITISFWVKSSATGTYCFSLANEAANRSYVAEYTIDSADTWEKKEITIAGDASGTWNKTNGIGLNCRWALAVGSDFQGTAGTWESANDYGSASQENWMYTLNNTFYLSQVQIEVGDTATEFEHRPIGIELVLCQRYFCKSYDFTVNPATVDGDGCFTWRASASDASGSVTVAYPVTMRATPTILVYSPTTGTSFEVRNDGAAADITGASTNVGTNSCRIYSSVAQTDGDTCRFHYTASAEMT